MTKKITVLATALLLATPIFASASFGRGGGIEIGASGVLTTSGTLSMSDGVLLSSGDVSGATISGTNVAVLVSAETAGGDGDVTYANGATVQVTGTHIGDITTDATDAGALTVTGSGAVIGTINMNTAEAGTPALTIGFDGPVGGITVDSIGSGITTGIAGTVTLQRDLVFAEGARFTLGHANDSVTVAAGAHAVHFSNVTISDPVTFSTGDVVLDGDVTLSDTLTFAATGHVIDGNDHVMTLAAGAALAVGDGNDVEVRNLVVATDSQFTNFLSANAVGPDQTTIFNNVTVDSVWFDNIQFDAATGATTLAGSALTMAVADASRPATIKLLDDLALTGTGVWTVADGITFDLNGHTLDLTGVTNALSFPSGSAAVTMKNGVLIIGIASFLFDTTKANSQIDAYNLTLRATTDDTTFLTDGVLNVRSDCLLQLINTGDDTGAVLTIDPTDSHEGAIVLWSANLWYDTMGLATAGSLTPSTVAAHDEVDADIARLRKADPASDARLLEVGAGGSVTLANITDLANLTIDDVSNFGIEAYSTTGTVTVADFTAGSISIPSDMSLNSSRKFSIVQSADANENYTINGQGFQLHAYNGTGELFSVVTVDANANNNVALTLTNTILNNFSLVDHIHVEGANIGSGTAGFSFGDGVVVNLGDDVDSTENLEVSIAGTSDVLFDLQGHEVDGVTFVIGAGSTVTFRNGRLKNPSFIVAHDENPTVVFDNLELIVTGTTTLGAANLTAGIVDAAEANNAISFEFAGNTVVSGGGTLVIAPDNNQAVNATNAHVTVNADSVLTLDRTNLTIATKDDVTNAEALILTGTLELIGSTITVDGIAATLNSGTVVIDHTSTVAFANAATLNLGDAAAAINLVVMPGALLKTTGAGTLSIDTTA